VNQASSFLKKPQIPFILWGILLILSLVYAAERVSFADSAWQFFQKLNSEQFIFPQFRYGVFWMAVPSWLFIKLGFPLPAQLYLFSFSYMAFYAFLGWICHGPLKNPKAGWLVLLCLILGTRQSFVHTISETHEVLAFAALFYAVLQSALRPYVKWPLALLIMGNTMLTHPIAVFVLAFVVLVEVVKLEKEKMGIQLGLLGALGLWSVSRFLFSSGNYDAGQYALLKDIGVNDLLPWHWVSLKFLATRSYYLYWPTGIVAVWSFIQLWKSGQKWKAFLLFGFVGIYTLIALVTFRAGDSDYMMEKNFLPSVFMVSLIFLDTLFSCEGAKLEIGSRWLLFICIGGLFICWRGIQVFSLRLEKMDQLIEASLARNQSKSYVFASELEEETMLATWALGVETYMRSLSHLGKPCTIYSVTTTKEIQHTNDLVAVPWENISKEKLNPKFFFSDTTHYQLLQVE
jgi:hypothetical protein